MLNITRKIITVAATGAMLLNTFAPVALADTKITLSGNGSSSTNTANVTVDHTTTVVQSNDATISNDIDSNASTGGNSANDNTNGDVLISTGDARSKVDVTTEVNLNKADLDNCNGCNTDIRVNISGNGSYSDNSVELDNSSDTSVFQDNKADITNDIDSNAYTGKNDANRNTGGDVTIVTRNATSNVDVRNAANANVAKIGSGDGSQGSLDATISGNGSYSDNSIDLNHDVSRTLVQDNDAYIMNYVDANAKTGRNNANDNTGGDVVIATGDARTNVDVRNLANFNAADLNCGCLTDISAKISGNGSNSTNDITAYLVDSNSVFQDNELDIYNDVDADAKTGKNYANRNTGPAVGDPTVILTGNARSDTDVRNTGNVNLFGTGVSFPHDVQLDLSFDLGGLLGFLHH
ncbi:MAG: hypothetical protein A2857_06835 [Candidatus Levybacteria bacterium RIFCSPHIGHO2_01_FULL_36_15]|nr:MAG: hypothetical protein A2857_06835 [Candidatus Levybacteria bacterium RIFCSPHIGHO2_01_FULL_36_15]OGH37809.1 MAG: hypothetical protein A2905_00160 [Candidatus Levybacteria bacterium RIFCSPLOWO2_01_FULL_36_10]